MCKTTPNVQTHHQQVDMLYSIPRYNPDWAVALGAVLAAMQLQAAEGQMARL